MDPHEVQAANTEALETRFDRSLRPVRGVVVFNAVGTTGLEDRALLTEVASLGLDLVENQPADLGAEHIVVAPVYGQRLAQADLGQAGTIERRRVEVAGAVLPGGLDGGYRLVIGNVAEHISQRRRTEPERATEQCFSDVHASS